MHYILYYELRSTPSLHLRIPCLTISKYWNGIHAELQDDPFMHILNARLMHRLDAILMRTLHAISVHILDDVLMHTFNVIFMRCRCMDPILHSFMYSMSWSYRYIVCYILAFTELLRFTKKFVFGAWCEHSYHKKKKNIYICIH